MTFSVNGQLNLNAYFVLCIIIQLRIKNEKVIEYFHKCLVIIIIYKTDVHSVE